MYDPSSKLEFLLDSGADISVLPKSVLRDKKISDSQGFVLVAANGTKIKTFGSKLLLLSLGLRRKFHHSFVIADVEYPIIGADFLSKFNLILDFEQRKLRDSLTDLKIMCFIWGTDLGTDYLIPLDVKQGLVGWRNKWCENKTTQFCTTRSKFNRVLSDYIMELFIEYYLQ